MTEIFNVNTGQFQTDTTGKLHKMREWAKANYPNIMVEYRDDGLILIRPDDENFTLTQAQKDAIIAKWQTL